MITTTKRELREALRALVQAAEKVEPADCPECNFGLPGYHRGDCEYGPAIDAARAILARPARVTAYRVTGKVSGHANTWRVGGRQTVEWCLAQARKYRRQYGGRPTRLVVR